MGSEGERREQRGAKGAKGAKGSEGSEGSEGERRERRERTSHLVKLSLPDISTSTSENRVPDCLGHVLPPSVDFKPAQ